MLKVSTRNQKSVDKIDSISVFAQSFDDIGVNEWILGKLIRKIVNSYES